MDKHNNKKSPILRLFVMLDLMNILFVCRGNVGRSQAAMSFYNQLGIGHADSAGTILKYPYQRLVDNGVADNVIEVMSEYGIDVSNNIPSEVKEKNLAGYDRLIVMAEPDTIPEWLKNDPKTELWEVPDVKGQDIKTTRKILEQIKELVNSL
jgi:arsenate reductase